MWWSYTTTDDRYARVFFPHEVKNMIVKLHDLVSAVNQKRFLVHIMNKVSVSAGWIKVFAIQRKNGIIMNVGVRVKS